MFTFWMENIHIVGGGGVLHSQLGEGLEGEVVHHQYQHGAGSRVYTGDVIVG